MSCEHNFKLENGNKVCQKCKHIIYEVECYSRVVGYIRPIKNFNDSQYQQFLDRKMFDEGIKNV